MSLSTSLDSASSPLVRVSILKSLSESFSVIGSWDVNPQFGLGPTYRESLRGNLGLGMALSGHYDCHENIIANCGNPLASFAFLVVASGVAIFGIYVVRQRRRSPAREEPKSERVFVDEEGWESKAED